MNIFSLFAFYFKDKFTLKKREEIFLPSWGLKWILYFIFGIFFTVWCIGSLKDLINHTYSFAKDIRVIRSFLPGFLLIFVLFYVGVLASYVKIKDGYIEYVQYFLKRRKLVIKDITKVEYIWLKGIALTIRIKSNDKYIDINDAFFNFKDKKKAMMLIGYPNFVKQKIKSEMTKDELKKYNVSKKKGIKQILNFIISILIVSDIVLIISYIFKDYKNFIAFLSRISFVVIIIGGSFLTQLIEEFTKKFKLKKIIILIIVFIFITLMLCFLRIYLK